MLIIGGGPGGVASALLLASRGIEVHVFEKHDRLGGRTSAHEIDGYRFDIGPTFLMMKSLLDRIFIEAGKDSADYLRLRAARSDVRLRYDDEIFRACNNNEDTKAEIERLFPGQSAAMDVFLKKEKARLSKLLPAFERTFPLPSRPFARPASGAAASLARFDGFRQSEEVFSGQKLALLFSFQSKYLGMSAWECPGAFAMLSYMESTSPASIAPSAAQRDPCRSRAGRG